jgi:hypothetical protein
VGPVRCRGPVDINFVFVFAPGRHGWSSARLSAGSVGGGRGDAGLFGGAGRWLQPASMTDLFQVPRRDCRSKARQGTGRVGRRYVGGSVVKKGRPAVAGQHPPPLAPEWCSGENPASRRGSGPVGGGRRGGAKRARCRLGSQAGAPLLFLPPFPDEKEAFVPRPGTQTGRRPGGEDSLARFLGVSIHTRARTESGSLERALRVAERHGCRASRRGARCHATAQAADPCRVLPSGRASRPAIRAASAAVARAARAALGAGRHLSSTRVVSALSGPRGALAGRKR